MERRWFSAKEEGKIFGIPLKTLLSLAARHRLPEKREVASGAVKPGGGFLSLHELQDAKLILNDKDYCLRFTSASDWKELRAKILERRMTIPAFTFWICQKCGWRIKMSGTISEPVFCFKCNLALYKEGGMMRAMKQGEIIKYEADQAAAFKRQVEEDKKRAKAYRDAYNMGLVK